MKCGTFDRFGTRKGLLTQLEAGLALAAQAQQERRSGQKSFFADDPTIPLLGPSDGHEEFAKSELLRFERELLGLYVSGHPLDSIEDRLALMRTCAIEQLKDQPDGKELFLGGRIESVRVITTNAGKRMAFVRVEDLSGQVEVTLFPEVYEHAKRLVKEDQIVWVRGRAERRSERSVQVVAEELLSLEEAERSVHLYLHVEPEQVTEPFVQRLKEILAASPGAALVSVRLTGDEPVTVHLEVRIGLTKALLKQLEALLGDPAKVQRLTRKGGRSL